MVTPLTAQQTIDRARSLLESGRGAALPELLKLVETLSLNICEVTISDLAELIEKDGVVLARIISVANKLAHNPGISQIATLSQAIHQVGYNRIRSIAVSMMLLENAGASNAPEQREAASLALSSGLIAQGAAEFTGTHDPEFVFACATLRHFGRILMATISPELYRNAGKLTEANPAVDGFRSQFGLPALELSRRVLGGARLPEEVMRALRDCEPESLGGIATTYDSRLLGLADFGSRLAVLALDRREGPDGFIQKLTQLSRRFQRLVPGSEDIAKPALLRANERLRSFSRCPGVNGLPSANLHRLRQRLETIAPGAAAAAERLELQMSVTSGSTTPPLDPVTYTPTQHAITEEEPAAAEPVESTPEAFTPVEPQASVVPPEVTAPEAAPAPAWDAALATSPSFAAQRFEPVACDSISTAVAAARDLTQAKECWFFHSPPGATGLSLLGGVGESWLRFQPRAAIRCDERSVFGVCLSRNEVVLVHDTSDPTLRSYLPAWWLELGGGPRAFALIPLAVAGTARALALVGWPEARRVTLSHAQVRAVQPLFAPILQAAPRAA